MRTTASILHHDTVERELADRLRTAPRNQRAALYTEVYEELFRRVPDHPQLVKKSTVSRTRAAAREIAFLRRFLAPRKTFAEIGAGDCAVALQAAELCKRVYAIDISPTIMSRISEAPERFTPLLSDGTSIPVPDSSVDVIYSNQLMEHLHPEDAVEQLRNIWLALRPGGVYICSTPNRLNGPHDVSRYFRDEATGLHLREYTTREVADLMHGVGFAEVVPYVGKAPLHFPIPIEIVFLIEGKLSSMPRPTCRSIGAFALFRNVLGIRVVATKPV